MTRIQSTARAGPRAPQGPAVVEVDGVTKRYEGHVAVRGVSFSVARARIFGLLGPNGAGKTTTIRMIMDIIAPDEGEIRFFGGARDERTGTQIGYLPEERGLYRKMTVRDHLRFLAEIRGVPKREMDARIDDWIARMELEDWYDRKVEELSKGMQQKVQFIGTVINDPPLWILDEPFSGLDPINASLLKSFMEEARERGTAIIFSTHVLEQAEKLCDDICLIKSGRKILEGPLAEVRERYRTPSYLLRTTAPHGLRDLPGVERVERAGERVRVVLDTHDGRDFLRAALETTDVTEFQREEPDLEKVFLEAVRNAGGEPAS